MSMIRGIVLDWDGVWTDGTKSAEGQSVFSEHDTMGINLLRFAHYLHTDSWLPVAVVTGERNLTAEHLVHREHFDQFLFYARDKTKTIPFLEDRWGIKASSWGFVFDDVLDFGLAEKVGRRAMVTWPATAHTQRLAQAKGLVDDWVDPPNPVRRWCEHYLHEQGWLEQAVAERQSWSARYQAYWALRNEREPECLDLSR